ncbi:hypothetical protein PM082_018827 [Marasmius tenuissimus]|nr:hypothetical protein PM082_018827 [Marasmius tenuissimus]
MQRILCEKCQTELPSPRPFEFTYSKFLRSDYSPTDEELSDLKKVLGEEEEQLKRHKEDITILQDKLKRLEAGKSTLKSNIKKCQSVVSTKWRLPVGLWELIFSIFCTSLHNYSFKVDYRYTQPVTMPPVIISQVCSRWRGIARSCPRLWSSLSIELNNLSHNIDAPLAAYLEKAKSYPLTIRVERYDRWSTSNEILPLPTQQSRDAWAILAPNLFRCTHLIVRVNNYNFTEAPSGLSFPNLTSLYEEDYGNNGLEQLDETNRPRWYWDAIRAAPKLTEASIYCLHSTDSIPYHQLTSLSLLFISGRIEAEPFFRVLPSCAKLVSLKIVSPNDREMTNIWQPQAIVLPSLRILSIDTNYCDLPNPLRPSPDENVILSRLFLSLSIQSLTNFSIEFHHEWPLHLTHLLEKCSSSLRRIEITQVLEGRQLPGSAIRDHIIGLLQSLPHLRHLELFFGEKRPVGLPIFRSSIPQDLTPVDDLLWSLLSKLGMLGSPALLPKLESLSLSFSDITLNDKITENILNLVSRRLETSSPLKDFCLTRRDAEAFTPSPPLVERINTLKQQGVNVVVERIGPSN